MLQMNNVTKSSVKTVRSNIGITIPGEGGQSDDDRGREEENEEDDAEADLAAAEDQSTGGSLRWTGIVLGMAPMFYRHMTSWFNSFPLSKC